MIMFAHERWGSDDDRLSIETKSFLTIAEQALLEKDEEGVWKTDNIRLQEWEALSKKEGSLESINRRIAAMHKLEENRKSVNLRSHQQQQTRYLNQSTIDILKTYHQWTSNTTETSPKSNFDHITKTVTKIFRTKKIPK